MHIQRVLRARLRACAPLAIAALALQTGCAASQSTSRPPSGPGAAVGTPADAAIPDSAVIALEVQLRRTAELSDNRGVLRVFDQSVNVQFRVRGRGPGLDAGNVSFDGMPMHREVSGRGAVSYRLGREEPEGGFRAGGDPWSTIAASGGPGVPATSARVKLAPFPLVTEPIPWKTIPRTQELSVVMLPPVPDTWFRVSMVGAGESVAASDLGDGRWLFPLGALASLSTGRAHILIEVETSCGSCPGPVGLRLNWSSHTELEVPLTLL